ncbi:MAG TPA: regulatory iron-sulfur-containing complex subunit RicT [Saprospiraceae bacterium]|nr:regulatory iron-sulfur-containing complex subunit RicT [Saprospiraceae bacterium]
MGCSSCASSKNGKPAGCKSNGSCQNGGCNKLNTFDWLSQYNIHEPDEFRVVEISFKNGVRKDFYYNPPYLDASTGDLVTVEADGGFNVGVISLSGELTRLQMKKKRVKEDKRLPKILRIATEQDIKSLEEARALERNTMIRSRAISRSLKLEMKIGEVEYQADKRKATFYYIADGRVDFRELIRHYAREFRIKVDMRQIGSRQESGLIGGLGSCGRELCCSTWLTNFKSVSTSAARYQNLAINQSKLSGQCGRLKCCLNYELDTYLDALSKFPRRANTLEAQNGQAKLVKKDIFKGLMYYSFNQDGFRSRLYALEIDTVKDIISMNKRGEKPEDFQSLDIYYQSEMESQDLDFADINEVIELPAEKRKKTKKKKNWSGQKKNKARGDKKKPKNRNKKKD